MPREFQHPFHKLPWLLEEEYDSLEDLRYMDGRVWTREQRQPAVLPLWMDEEDEEEDVQPRRSTNTGRRHRYHRQDEDEASLEVVAPLIDPRRAVLLPGYTGDQYLSVWMKSDDDDDDLCLNNRSSSKPDNPNRNTSTSKFEIPKIVETQSLGTSAPSTSSTTSSSGSVDADTHVTNNNGNSNQHQTDTPGGERKQKKKKKKKKKKKSQQQDPGKLNDQHSRLSLNSLRRSSTLTRINEFLQRARSEVFEGDDGKSTREKIRHLLRNSHADDAQRLVTLCC
ncbi:hypothetical protein Pmani_023598 [Petrolisthes manimaculis]|uniref:Uncharacterized protein n=1 Tax=Petrolisthes manimaculis TaxID=1843537 RepID=A0AAE1PBP2_9EUCA|nr:hypothetical protein Pmani_023598 [Petrolisthes manimaculis]